MTGSIRLRIGLAVSSVVFALQCGLSVLAVNGLKRLHRRQADERLVDEIREVRTLIGTPDVDAFIRAEYNESKWDKAFCEVSDASGRRLFASENVPAAGLGRVASAQAEALRPDAVAPVRYWEQAHPHSRSGHVHVRIAEATEDGRTIRVALSMKSYEQMWRHLRRQLLLGSLAVAAIGGVVAAAVAQRSLGMIRAFTERAQAIAAQLDR